MSKLITVPVVASFGNGEVIGSLTISSDALPVAPGFVFGLAYKTLDPHSYVAGELQRAPYTGRYELVSVAPVPDESYAEFLKQIGVA